MISDEQRKAFENWAKPEKFNLDARANGAYMNYRTNFVYMGWQAAQEVNEPVWRLVSGYMVADTDIGQYTIDYDAGYYTIIFHDIKYRVLYDTGAEAIEAANADYKRRVLSCLVNGGV